MDIKIDAKTVIVFDLDDTLYNEIDYLRSAYLEIARTLSPNEWKTLFVRMFSLYRCGQNVFQYLSENYNVSVENLLISYREHLPNIVPFDGVLSVLKKIKKSEGKIGIITDGRESTQRKKINSLGLMGYIDKLVISGETGYEKPDNHNFKVIEDTFQDANYCYIADNLRKDFVAPKRLGWNTIGVIDKGMNIHRDAYLHFDEAKIPEHYIFSFEDIRIL